MGGGKGGNDGRRREGWELMMGGGKGGTDGRSECNNDTHE